MSSERPRTPVDRLSIFAIALLGTCLSPSFAAAQLVSVGGAGAGGAAGGQSQASGAGDSGTSGATGGGGGGAGQTGGTGGNGVGAGGLGGVAPGSSGQAGTIGGGGGGGAHFQVVTTPGALTSGVGGAGGAGGADAGGGGGGGAAGWGASITGGGSFTNAGSLSGGGGGNGGAGGNGGGGGGGGLGVGIDSAAPVSLTNSSAITGGNAGAAASVGTGFGGFGGTGVAFLTGNGHTFINGPGATVTGGTGGLNGDSTPDLGPGSGGHGVISLGSATVFNDAGATIAGGNGVAGGTGQGGGGGFGVAVSGGTVTNLGTIRGGDAQPSAGPTFVNGVGVVVRDGTTVINIGSIIGGLQFDGVTRIAVTLGTGNNVLELRAGSTITGFVLADTGTNTLRLGGAADSSFDISQVGPAVTPFTTGVQYQGFVAFEKTGSSTWTLSGTTTETTSWSVSGGALSISSDANLGAAGGTLTLAGGALRTTASFSSARSITLGGGTTNTIETAAGTTLTWDGVIGGDGLTKTGSGTLTLTGANTYNGGTAINGGTLAVANVASLGGGGLSFDGGTLRALGVLPLNAAITLNGGGGTIDTNGNAAVVTSVISGAGGLTKTGNGMLSFQTAMTYSGGTTINAGTLFLDSVGGMLPTGGALTVNGGLLDMADAGAGQSVGALAGTGGQISLGANSLTTNSSASTTLATTITGTGALIKQGAGTLTLTGNNLYSGGTQIQGGLVNFSSLNNFGTGTITLNGGGLQWAAGNTIDPSSRLVLGAGGGTLDTNGNAVALASAITGGGGLTKQGSGTLNLTGTNTYTGATSVNVGTLAVNGSITSNTTVGAAGTLGGTGTIIGATTIQGTLAPGNSIGTLNVTGNFTQAAGSIYQVEANAQGQADRINITGTATIQGGTVQVLAQPGTYGPSTTYTILSANGGRAGAYDSVTSNFAFLTPSLSYDANNVFLTLALLPGGGGGGFLMSAYTPNQKAVGAALNQSFANASGDYATVIGTLAGLNAFAGPAALNAISGEQYADFGTMNLNNAAMFMGAIGQQLALARGVTASGGQRASLAQACDVAACDGASPFSVWASALGGVGSVNGDYNASTATYNFGGGAVGIDYRLAPNILVGLATTYTSGNLWVNGFSGKGWSNSVGVAAYGSFTLDGFYADLLGGYAYYGNQLQRQIAIPGLQRTAWGSTGANQALGQVETGYRFGVYSPANATIAPFARLQGSSVTQNGFTETGAQSLNLNVNQQTTNSLRTLFGIDLAGALPIASDRTVDVGFRLGWSHEFASTQRPITAALSGAPFAGFTVYGATPQPDAAVVSFRAATTVAAGAQLYLRYDGEVGSGTDNHALNLGLRVSW